MPSWSLFRQASRLLATRSSSYQTTPSAAKSTQSNLKQIALSELQRLTTIIDRKPQIAGHAAESAQIRIDKHIRSSHLACRVPLTDAMAAVKQLRSRLQVENSHKSLLMLIEVHLQTITDNLDNLPREESVKLDEFLQDLYSKNVVCSSQYLNALKQALVHQPMFLAEDVQIEAKKEAIQVETNIKKLVAITLDDVKAGLSEKPEPKNSSDSSIPYSKLGIY